MEKSGKIILFFIIIICAFSIITVRGVDNEMTDVPTGTHGEQVIEQNVGDPAGQVPAAPLSSPAHLDTKLGTVDIPSGSTVSVSNGDLASSAVDSADTKSGVKLSSASDVVISKNGDVAATNAASVKIGSVTITNGNHVKYDAAKRTVAVDSATKITDSQRFITFDNLKETSIQIADNIQRITATTETKQTFKSLLVDGMVETSAAKDGSITIDLTKYHDANKGSIVTYTVNKATLTIKTPQQKPIITAQPSKTDTPQTVEITQADNGYITRAENSIITITTDQIDERFLGSETIFAWNIIDGVTSATLQSPGAYRYTYKELQQDRNGIYARADKTFAQSYELSRQQGLPLYQIFVDKPSKRTQLKDVKLDANSAYLSLPNHHHTINGITTYSRINFDLKTTQRFMGGTWWTEIIPADGSYLPIVESNTEATTTSVQLDANNLHANITITPAFTTGKAYTAYFDDLTISETKDELTRTWTTAPFIIDEFKTTTQPTLMFKNTPNDSWTVTQYNNNIAVAQFHSKQDQQQKILDKELTPYANPQCDDLNQKIGIGDLFASIRGLLT